MVTEVGECMVVRDDRERHIGDVLDTSILREDNQLHPIRLCFISEATEADFVAWLSSQGLSYRARPDRPYFYRVSTD